MVGLSERPALGGARYCIDRVYIVRGGARAARAHPRLSHRASDADRGGRGAECRTQRPVEPPVAGRPGPALHAAAGRRVRPGRRRADEINFGRGVSTPNVYDEAADRK